MKRYENGHREGIRKLCDDEMRSVMGGSVIEFPVLQEYYVFDEVGGVYVMIFSGFGAERKAYWADEQFARLTSERKEYVRRKARQGKMGFKYWY